jgi:hypothetical protein
MCRAAPLEDQRNGNRFLRHNRCLLPGIELLLEFIRNGLLVRLAIPVLVVDV